MDALLVGSADRAEKSRLAPRMRRLLLLLAVTLLCCATYLAGIWVGSSGRMTCVSTAEGGLVCDDSGKLPAPSSPEPALRESGSA